MLITLFKKHKKSSRKRRELIRLKTSEGISNFQIEEALRGLNDPDINNNFVGAFAANHMNRFIDCKSMISEKKENIPS